MLLDHKNNSDGKINNCIIQAGEAASGPNRLYVYFSISWLTVATATAATPTIRFIPAPIVDSHEQKYVRLVTLLLNITFQFYINNKYT